MIFWVSTPELRERTQEEKKNKPRTSEISIGVIILVGEKEEGGEGEINLQCYREIFGDTYASH